MISKPKEYTIKIDGLRAYDGGPDFSKAYFEGTFYVLYDGVCIGGRTESQPWDKEDFVKLVSGIIARHTYAQLGYQWSQLIYSALTSKLKDAYPITEYFASASDTATVKCWLGSDKPVVEVDNDRY